MDKPPNTVELYDFSYARQTGNMRWRLYEHYEIDPEGSVLFTGAKIGEWECAELAGKAYVADCGGEGNMAIRCRLIVEPSPDGGFIGFTYKE